MGGPAREQDREVPGARVELEEPSSRLDDELGDATRELRVHALVRLREAAGRELERRAVGAVDDGRGIADERGLSRLAASNAEALERARSHARVEACHHGRREIARPRDVRDGRRAADREAHVAFAAAALEDRLELRARAVDAPVEHGALVDAHERARSRSEPPDVDASALVTRVEAGARAIREIVVRGVKLDRRSTGDRRCERQVLFALRGAREVHPVAAAAHLDERARRRHARRARLEDLDDFAARGALRRIEPNAHELRRRRAAHEHRAPLAIALAVRDGLAARRHRRRSHLGFDEVVFHGRHAKTA